MRFEVQYLANYSILSRSKKISLNFLTKKGFIFLNETGLVLQGKISKINLGLLYSFYDKVLDIETTRTIPYSTILYYKNATLFSRAYKIIYRLPDGKNCIVSFIMIGSQRKNNTELFTTKLEEYLAVAKVFSNQ